MNVLKQIAALGLGAAAMAGAVQAAPVKIGLITTLSGPSGYLGQETRDGFMLAVKAGGGKLGGVDVDIASEDDALDPGKSKQIADRMLKQDGVQLFTGSVFSNVMLAEAPPVLAAGAFFVSPNAGPSQFAGKACNKNLFVASWQNDTSHEAAGAYAKAQGYKKVVILAANYAAGRDSLAGFKRLYKDPVAAEIYTKLDQTDYSAELAQIRDMKPDAIYQAHPGGLGINFNKQFAQAGLNKTIKVLVPFASMEQRMMEAVGDDAIGVMGFGSWAPDLPNATNKKFVADFQKAYGRIPTDYAAQSYDTANLIASALQAVGGDMSKKDAFRAALKKASFDSVRGKFAFGENQFPILDFYGRVVEKQADGKLALKTFAKVLSDHQDSYVSQCKL